MKEFLPIGSVVLLKNAKKKIMITGFCMVDKSNSNKMYDYSGCLYPEGIINTSTNILFDHNQISDIYYIGFKNDEENEFKGKLKEALQKNKINLNEDELIIEDV